MENNSTDLCNNMLTFMFAGIPVMITIVIVIIYFLLDVENANKKLSK